MKQLIENSIFCSRRLWS